MIIVLHNCIICKLANFLTCCSMFQTLGLAKQDRLSVTGNVLSFMVAAICTRLSDLIGIVSPKLKFET